jgi:hypothetical protein
VWPDSRCRFCLTEGRIRPQEARQKRTTLIADSGGITVQRITEKKKGQRAEQQTKKLAGDLGL